MRIYLSTTSIFLEASQKINDKMSTVCFYPFSFKFSIIRPSKQTKHLFEKKIFIRNIDLYETATLGKIVIDILAGAAKNALSESDD